MYVKLLSCRHIKVSLLFDPIYHRRAEGSEQLLQVAEHFHPSENKGLSHETQLKHSKYDKNTDEVAEDFL